MNKDKYKILRAVAIVLLALLMFKSCQSCSRGSQIKYQQVQYEHVVDSLNHIVSNTTRELTLAQDSIKILNYRIGSLMEQKSLLDGSLKHSRMQNANLVKTIQNTQNKENK